MRITVTGRRAEVKDSLKQYASEKASKLTHYYDRVHSVDIVFDVDGLRHRCEVIAKADHAANFVAREEHEEAFASLDAALRDLERQLTRHKEKCRDRKHRGGRVEKGSPVGPATEEESDKPLTEGEAS
jgi:putative sigma-54 modulation protein